MASGQQWQDEWAWDNTPSSTLLTESDLHFHMLLDSSHLTDLGDIFAFTNDSSVFPARPPVVPPLIDTGSHASSTFDISVDAAGLGHADAEFLRSQGCFDLPPPAVLKLFMRQYFRMVHPNLPVVVENSFWARWEGDTFNLAQLSLLVLRTMLFAASCYVDNSTLAGLGFNGQRQARNLYYRQAKLVFDFGIEVDPIANAQACLLLSYMSPSLSRLQINVGWLVHAHRFAKIAGADSFYRYIDEDRSTAVLLKRIWWGVLFRDRILSFGFRRSLQVHLEHDSIWLNDRYALNSDDFESELGQSPIHDTETQLKNIEVLSALCRLISRLLGPLRLLYQYDMLDGRLQPASINLPATITAIKAHLVSLRIWHDDTIEKFPFPIEDSHSELQVANTDLGRRFQEMVQLRVMKDLPITAIPFLAPPLILQAINVTASRGLRTESNEARHLDIFTRTLKSQQGRYDGSEFLIDVLNNVISYAQQNEDLTTSMNTWRKSSSGDDGPSNRDQNSEDNSRQNPTRRLDWNTMVRKQPKLLLRLMFHLDYALRSPASLDAVESSRSRAATTSASPMMNDWAENTPHSDGELVQLSTWNSRSETQHIIGINMQQTDLQSIAKALHNARQTSKPIQPPTKTWPQLTPDDAFRVQQITLHNALQTGDRLVGWKLGNIAKVMQDAFGLDQPDYGSLLASTFIYEGTSIDLKNLIKPYVELEPAFILKKPLRGPNVTVADVISAVECCLPAIEIIDSRVRDWQIGLPDTLADNGSTGAVVLGGRPRRLEELVLSDTKGVLYFNGGEVITGNTANVLGNPLAAVAWLANRLAAFDVSLEAGHVVLPGSCLQAIPMWEAGHWKGVFVGFGSVEFEVVGALPASASEFRSGGVKAKL
ncbi:hypothetical protein CBER1_05303 [Cercospora berteroae]|uniref:Xylanolytic transcriptional activator regulatory domain-containing protein n=1 Tax=Cercospora berteroae TaxID=357750 RepID=A0A2S6CEF0_9PEZI|nr:hypothetical protein CBER1_05303 [Cercospora berteroae]